MSAIPPPFPAIAGASDPGLAALLVNLAGSLFMVGFIWTMQVVHYPLFDRVGDATFPAYEAVHNRVFFLVAGPATLLVAVSGLLLLRERPSAVPLAAVVTGLVLVGVVAASTTLFQAPQHAKLSAGFDEGAYRFLLATNWIRTIAWTAYGLLDLWLMWRVVRNMT